MSFVTSRIQAVVWALARRVMKLVGIFDVEDGAVDMTVLNETA